MKKKIFRILALATLSTLFSCTDIDDQPNYSDRDVYDFVWKGLNKYYLYQENVPNLNDSRFSNQNELDIFLNNYNKPETLFESLLYNRGTIDRFSVIFNDYTKLEQVLSGSNDTNGMEYGVSLKTGSSTDVFGWVKYVMPNSDAASKNISRGTIFYAIDGIPLTMSNYQGLLNKTSYTLNLADYNNGAITPNGQSVTLEKKPYTENPVFLTKTIDLGSKKVGYLMYNGFFSAFDTQLNEAFGSLKANGISDLVLDLRYNSGGSVATATRLASMITGQFTGQTFAKQQWNSKYMASTDPANLINPFTNTLGNGSAINSLGLSKVYILTTKSTASASELVINGLKPYVNVIQIGRTTTGKNVGSITLYDSPNFQKQKLNPTHKYAMQPLVLKIVNKDGFGDYSSGLTPTYELAENLANLGKLGEIDEPYLAKALGLIQNIRLGIQKSKDFKTHEEIIDKSIRNLEMEMYID
ncbi:S41 family peptidase [Flavobacterium sp.]|uniref:S41 family peptidase n=1 Tax=Flavobacterium sp. TaxID=239 RepID=UPI003D0B1701